MASYTKRGERWRVQIRRKGHELVKSFRTKAAAETWARSIEAQIDAGETPTLAVRAPTVSELIRTYRDLREVSRPVLDTSTEHYMLNHLESFLGDKSSLSPSDLVDFCKWRKREGAGPYTLNMEVSKLGTVLRYAGSAQQLKLPDVVGEARPLLTHLKLIGGGGKRERRPTEDELANILATLPGKIADVVRFAIASCMRRGEITKLVWTDLDQSKRLVVVRDRKDPRNKIGNHQLVPLLGEAWELVMRQPKEEDRIFPYHEQTLTKAFTTACQSLSIPDLHFHDLRHEGISRLFEQGYEIQQVALVSGHKDWRHLRRYTNLRPESLHGLAPGSGQGARLRLVSPRSVSRRRDK